MSAICVGTIRLKNANLWEQYRSRVGATITQYGGEVLFRGRQLRAFAGVPTHEHVVALRFVDIAAAERWHDSAEYQALVPLRDQAAEVTLCLYEE